MSSTCGSEIDPKDVISDLMPVFCSPKHPFSRDRHQDAWIQDAIKAIRGGQILPLEIAQRALAILNEQCDNELDGRLMSGILDAVEPLKTRHHAFLKALIAEIEHAFIVYDIPDFRLCPKFYPQGKTAE